MNDLNSDFAFICFGVIFSNDGGGKNQKTFVLFKAKEETLLCTSSKLPEG